jgi:hypothetical protein
VCHGVDHPIASLPVFTTLTGGWTFRSSPHDDPATSRWPSWNCSTLWSRFDVGGQAFQLAEGIAAVARVAHAAGCRRYLLGLPRVWKGTLRLSSAAPKPREIAVARYWAHRS